MRYLFEISHNSLKHKKRILAKKTLEVIKKKLSVIFTDLLVQSLFIIISKKNLPTMGCVSKS